MERKELEKVLTPALISKLERLRQMEEVAQAGESKRIWEKTLYVVFALPIAGVADSSRGTIDLWYAQSNLVPVFRIRIHWIRIRSQVFFWIRIQPVVKSGPNPDQDPDQDLFEQNVLENYFDQKPSDFSPWTPTNDVQTRHRWNVFIFPFLGASFGLSGSGYGPVCGDPIESGSKTTQDPRCYSPHHPSSTSISWSPNTAFLYLSFWNFQIQLAIALCSLNGSVLRARTSFAPSRWRSSIVDPDVYRKKLPVPYNWATRIKEDFCLEDLDFCFRIGRPGVLPFLSLPEDYAGSQWQGTNIQISGIYIKHSVLLIRDPVLFWPLDPG